MTTVNLDQLTLNEFVGKEYPQQHCKATFPMLGAQGTQSSATVYFELAPGDNLGSHTDSAEELLLILDGKVEVTVGNEKSQAEERALVHVPVMVPHDIRNIGNTTVKVLGFFGGANNIVATFENTWLPVESNRIDTAQIPAAV